MKKFIETIQNICKIEDLRNRLLTTFLFVVIYRLGSYIVLPGVDVNLLQQLSSSTEGGLMMLLDMFSGGAFSNASVFALGIMPYITASIVVQLLGMAIPYFQKLQREGESGRRKMDQITRYLTVILLLFQGPAYLLSLKYQVGAALPEGNFFMVTSTLILAAGSMFVLWLGERITEKGIGNGGSLIIFVGILSGIPLYASKTSDLVANNTSLMWGLLILLAIFFLTMVFIVVMQEAVRKVIIVNPKRQVGNKVYGGVNTFIPFKLNPGGVMPIIFAVAILLFPSTILSLVGQANLPAGWVQDMVMVLNKIFNPSGATYYAIYFFMIVALTFFYASIMPNMQPKEIADNLKKYGSSIPGVKPGRPTAEALDKILTKTTFIGAMGLGIIALVPAFASYITGITTLQGIGATSLIIMVGVALDLINQVKTHLLARNYESFLKE